MWNLLVKPVADVVNRIVDKVAPDAGMAEKLKFEITQALIQADNQTLQQQANVIMSEATGESWLQRNWRPISMLVFVGLVVAHWLGMTAPNLSEEQVLALLDIVQVGLGGYVIGRSAEKVMREYKR
ncbi:3TM-type holin [Methylophaga nitratireducenticrescens]|uniref:3TM-type holin n=1 Tax=Methylophaga nitratireducenticrescens TaxID=754476 RepID=UPI00146A1666|nr:3TM-type holin [Methylophaga nitratireducenticrescens]